MFQIPRIGNVNVHPQKPVVFCFDWIVEEDEDELESVKSDGEE
jgi:hypothetical protein